MRALATIAQFAFIIKTLPTPLINHEGLASYFAHRRTELDSRSLHALGFTHGNNVYISR